MTTNKKKQLAEAFDKGELPEENKPMEAGVAAYAGRLRDLDQALHRQPEVPVPAGFVRMVMKRLPASDAALRRVLGVRDVLLPLLILAALAMSFIFSDFLGFAPLARTVSDGLNSGGESSLQFGFLAITGCGILIASWFIISSFFGIRNRRVTRS